VKLLRSLYKGSQHGKRYNRDGPTVTELAKQFGISRVQVCRIINLESR
jgi:Mor family transcriptional regulator